MVMCLLNLSAPSYTVYMTVSAQDEKVRGLGCIIRESVSGASAPAPGILGESCRLRWSNKYKNKADNFSNLE